MEIDSPNPQAVVFVVDDDATVRDSMSSLIRSVGLRVELFGTAAEFLARKLPAAPCCLVLDVRLPRLSGLDLQAELAKANIQIPNKPRGYPDERTCHESGGGRIPDQAISGSGSV